MAGEIACRTEVYEADVPVEEYVEQCVDVAEFLPYCKACENYGKRWSCPGFSFDPEAYWRKYQTFHIVGVKIYVPEEMLDRAYTKGECREISDRIMRTEKRRIAAWLLEREKEAPGSISLSAGYCLECGEDACARALGQSCRHPDRLRYSIESLGGKVGLTVTKYRRQKLLWMEEGRLPEYFILVGGLLS